MVQLSQYDYVFAIGTFFAMLDAYNNGASEYIPDIGRQWSIH
jgi:sodium-dependent phosphate transporter